MIKRNRRNKFLIIALLVVIMAGLIIYSWHKMNSPTFGTIAVQKTISPAVTDSSSYSTLNNDYYSMLYPSELTPDFPAQKAANLLAYNYLSKKDDAQKVISSLEVYVKPLPYGGITLDSNYRFYQSQSKLYKLSRKFIRGETVVTATRDDAGYERVGLWVHGDYLMTIKFTSTSKDNLEVKFNTILKSISWLKS